VITALCVNIIAFFLVTVAVAGVSRGHKIDQPIIELIGWWYLAITVLAIITLALA
jgi:hypothetical protein